MCATERPVLVVRPFGRVPKIRRPLLRCAPSPPANLSEPPRCLARRFSSARRGRAAAVSGSRAAAQRRGLASRPRVSVSAASRPRITAPHHGPASRPRAAASRHCSRRGQAASSRSAPRFHAAAADRRRRPRAAAAGRRAGAPRSDRGGRSGGTSALAAHPLRTTKRTRRISCKFSIASRVCIFSWSCRGEAAEVGRRPPISCRSLISSPGGGHRRLLHMCAMACTGARHVPI